MSDVNVPVSLQQHVKRELAEQYGTSEVVLPEPQAYARKDDILSAARNYLDITWEDPEGDKKLSGILARGIKYLNQVAGAELDYDIDDKPRELLLDYARYVRSNALDEFQDNYVSELLMLQIGYALGYYDADEDGEDNGGGEMPANKVTRVRAAGANATAQFIGGRFAFSGGEFKYLTDKGWIAVTIRPYETDFVFDTDIVLNTTTGALVTMASYPTEDNYYWVGDMSIINGKRQVYIEGIGAFESDVE